MRSNGMRFSLMALILSMMVGCTHDIHPVAKDEGLYVTQIKGEKAQIVASQDFQRLVLKDVPLRSSNWKWQKFNVAIGKTLTDGVYSNVRKTYSDTRIGDAKDSDLSGLTFILTGATVELWIDDDSSFATQMVIAPAYYGTKVDAQAKVTLTGNIVLPDGNTKSLALTGHGLKNLRPQSMDADVVEEVTGLAAADVARQVVQQMRGISAQRAGQ